MTEITIIKHSKGAPGLRFFGLGPRYRPLRGIKKLQNLFNNHAFWTNNRSYREIKQMLAKSSVVISLWEKERLVGFGRATSDEIFRAVFWDIVVANDLQGTGLGRTVVETLLEAPEIKNVQRVYLMTTNCSDFYKQMGFKIVDAQKLLLIEKN